MNEKSPEMPRVRGFVNNLRTELVVLVPSSPMYLRQKERTHANRVPCEEIGLDI